MLEVQWGQLQEEGPSHRGAPPPHPTHFCEFYLQGIYQVLTVKTGEKSPHASCSWWRKVTFWNTPEHSILHNKSTLNRKTVLPEHKWLGFSEPDWRAGREIRISMWTQFHSTPAILYHLNEVEENQDALANFTAQGHRITKRLRPNHRIKDNFFSSTPYHITKGLFTTVPVHHVSFQQKIMKNTKRQKM